MNIPRSVPDLIQRVIDNIDFFHSRLTDGTTNSDVLPNSAAADATGKLGVASEVVDFDTGAGEDFTGAIGILCAGSSGATPLVINSSGLVVEVDGEYSAGNIDPDNVGLMAHTNVAAPADAQQTVRLTGGTIDQDTLIGANQHGLDVRNVNYYDDVVNSVNRRQQGDEDGNAFVTHRNGINIMPAMDVNTRAGFVQITDGINEAAIDVTTGGLKVDIVGEGGATISATNPVFVELTDGAAAIAPINPLSVEIGNGTTQADVIAIINSLKNDLSSVAGMVTNVNGGNRDAGTQTVAIADNDPIAVSLALLDDIVKTDDDAFTPATDKVAMVGAEFDDVAPDSVDEGDAGALRMSVNRNLYTQIRDAAGNERGVNVTGSNELNVIATVQPGVDIGDVTVNNAAGVSAVNIQDGGNSITVDNVALSVVGGGAEATALRVTIANDSTGVVSIDDNGGAITVDNAGTFVVQVDGAALTALQLIDDAVVSHDAPASGTGVQLIGEQVTFDGLAWTSVSAEGDAVRIKSLDGILPFFPVSRDGSQSPYDDANNALQIIDITPTSVSDEIQAATTITAVETVIGDEITISQYNTMTIWVDYTKGDETSYDIIPKFLRVPGGDEHAFNSWSSGAIRAVTAEKFRFTASGKHYITLDVTGLSIVKLYGSAIGGTPTGTSQISYEISHN